MTGLAWRLLRGGGRRGLLASGLTLAAVAVATGLLLFAAAANHAFAQRTAADAWRHAPASKTPTALAALDTDYVRDRPVAIVDLAALSADPPTPPGMSRFPRPGEVWVSPALKSLLARLPAGELARRFPGPVTGTLGRPAIVHPNELVAVVGRTATDPLMTADRAASDGRTSSPTRIAGFGGGTPGSSAIAYQILAAVATGLMVAPLLIFGGAAARLTVARRDQRLAALRLVGATPGQVVQITVMEAVLTAAAGALAGALLYGLAMPELRLIPMQGGPWFLGDLWVGLPTLAAILAGVPILVGVSAVVGLRRVVVSPLGVARRETPPGMRAARLAVFVSVLIGFVVVSAIGFGGKTTALVLVLVFLTLAFLSINLVGPWVVGLIGRMAAARARRPARLLAARRLMDDPRAAWRTVSGIALTGFIAGFMALLTPSPTLLGSPSTSRLEISAPVAAVQNRLPGLSVTSDHGVTSVTVPGGPAAVDRARTALTGVRPGRIAHTPADDEAPGLTMIADLRTGTLTVLVVAFLLAITSAGITGASSVLDRRQTYALLRLAGTPLSVLDKARRQETMIPLVVMGGGSLLTGVVFSLPFAFSASLAGALGLAAFVVFGVLGILGAGALSRPLLRSVTADPAPRPD